MDNSNSEIPPHLSYKMRLVFLERKELHEKIKTLVAEQLKGFPDYSYEEATLIENQLIHYSRLRDTLDMRLKLYDCFIE